LLIDGSRLARMQNADANGGLRVKQTNGEEAVGAVEDDRQLASCARSILPAHTLREDPRMPAAHNILRRRRDAEAKTCPAWDARFFCCFHWNGD